MKPSIKLQRYLENNSITDSAFSRLIGKTPAMIARYKKALSTPSYHAALEIQAATGGDIKKGEWGYAD